MKTEKTEPLVNPYINALLAKDIDSPAMWNNSVYYIEELYRAGVITSRQRLVYISLRSQCNPYGICTTSVDDIIADVFANKCERPYVNKILADMKKMRLVWFKDRKGVAGKFDVYFDDFICPQGKITDLQNKFNCRFKDISSSTFNHGELQVNSERRTHEKPTNAITVAKSLSNYVDKGVGSHTDKHNQTQKTTVFEDEKEYKCKNSTSTYEPSSNETLYILDMANEIGDTCLDWYLKLIVDGYFWAIEKAYGELKEDIQNGKSIENKAPYLNAIIMRMLRERATKSV